MKAPILLLISFLWLSVAFKVEAGGFPLPNLLADPGFESGTVVSKASGGWNVINSNFSEDYARSGPWSMRSPYDPSEFNAPALQFVGASPGQEYSASAWALTPSALPAGLKGGLIVFFLDANGGLLGGYNGAPEMVDENTPAGAWVPLAIDLTAPPQAASIYVEVTLFSLAPKPLPIGPAIYFDDVSLVAVPEPASTAIGALAGVALCCLRRRIRLFFDSTV